MAGGEQIYVDPSALLKLYIREPESRAMTAWRTRIREPLPITHHGRVELANGIALAAYRGFITPAIQLATLAALDDDLAQGRYQPADVLWRATLQRAAELGRTHTSTLGCRTLDILHVASALELGLKKFLTFDQRQRQLAQAIGLKLVIPPGP